MELLDSHAHYNDEKFKQDRDEIIKEIYNSGVTTIIVIYVYNIDKLFFVNKNVTQKSFER